MADLSGVPIEVVPSINRSFLGLTRTTSIGKFGRYSWGYGKVTIVTALGIQQQDNSAERAVSQAIGVGRILWGATTAIASKQVYNALGIAYPGSDLGVWIKAFGVRDIVLGAAALHPDSTVRRATLRAGIAMDLVDAVVVADAARRGLPRKAAMIGVALAGGTAAFAAFGPTLVRALRNQ